MGDYTVTATSELYLSVSLIISLTKFTNLNYHWEISFEALIKISKGSTCPKKQKGDKLEFLLFVTVLFNKLFSSGKLVAIQAEHNLWYKLVFSGVLFVLLYFLVDLFYCKN